MIAAWMLYSILVGALFGGAGWALERILRAHGLPSRWLWAGIILLSVAWPLGHGAWDNTPRRFSVVAAAPPVGEPLEAAPTSVLPLEYAVVEIPRESFLRGLDGPILTAWALATGALVLFSVFLFLRTRHLMGRWKEGTAGGRAVLFSREWGPAVVGFLRPRVVLPAWCGDLDEESLRFILDHEFEHVRSGDLRLILLFGLLPVFFPWHLPLWWQLKRMRTAVEGDCDLRVLRRNTGRTRAYVDLLLAVGERTAGARPLAAMLSEPFTTLKRRIRIMTMPMPKKPWIQGSLFAAGATVLFAFACWAPGPTDARQRADGSPGENISAADAGKGPTAQVVPTFTPYTVLPEIENRDAVMAALEREYASILAEEEIDGIVTVWFFADEEGRVQRTLVNESSGHRNLDFAGIKVADVIEFTPALNRDQPRAVWLSLPIAFTTRNGLQLEPASRRPGMAEIRRRAEARAASPVEPGPGNPGEVLGTVTDSHTGEPLAFVQVYVLGTGRGTLSGQDGRFRIERVPAGQQDVVADLVGYGPVARAVEVARGGRGNVDFALQPEAIGLEPLVVRGVARGRAPGLND